jgi:hypothetical protein
MGIVFGEGGGYNSGGGFDTPPSDPRLLPAPLARATEFNYANEAPSRTPDGLLYIRVENVGDSNAQFNGITLEPGKHKEYPFVGKGYQSMQYLSAASILRLTFII